MSIMITGKTVCEFCGLPIREEQKVVGFPAFLKASHRLYRFSDAIFHESCFLLDPEHQEVEALFQRYRSIWDSRPQDLLSLEDIERWGRGAFGEFE